jgi:NAD(P)-dependent dehydrogenase (short-subunit alcohol dehydrogenase family)
MALLDEKVALITGAGSGFGRAGALTFAREGAKVAVADVNAETGHQAVQAIRDNGGEAVFVHADISDVADVRRMVKEAVGAFGRLDIFWHNAGNVGPAGVEHVTEDQYDLTLSIHVKAGFFGAQFVLPEMRKLGGGVMLFTSSLAGLRTSRASPVYGIAKSAMVGLTRNLAVSFAPDRIRVNAICPGASETPLWPAFTNRGADDHDPRKTEQVTKAYRDKIPLGRLAEPQEIANAALFLCSDLASYVNGEILSVDGGLGVV